MRNKIILLLFSLTLFGSCIYDNDMSDSEDCLANDTYIAFRSSNITVPTENSAGLKIESITLNTLRILVFSKTTGNLVTNEVFDISNYTDPTAANNWTVDFSNVVVKTRPGLSVVYVVLNEDVSALGSQPLTASLNMLSNLTEMEALVKAPLSYIPLEVTYKADGVTPQEPPFIMSTFGEFAIPSGRTASTPFLADLRGPSASQSGFELDRTMAKITLESVSSNPMYPGQVTNNVATSYIFILKMGLVNVPQTYLWSPNREQSNPNPIQLPPYNGTYQTIDFALEDPVKKYYNRTWNGTITATATANVTWTQYGTAERRIYKIDGSNGINSYSTTYNGHLETKSTSNINSGNFLSFITLYFAGWVGDETLFDPSELEYTNTVVTPTVTGAYWSLNDKNISYYVPENILADKTSPTNATKLYVKAAKASIILDPDNVHFTENQVNWGRTPNLPNWTYPSDLGNLIQSTFLSEPIYGTNGTLLGYRHSWGGPAFWRKATGTISITLQSPEFSKIVDSNNIKEFYLPIRNAPDTPNDYNVYRNHEYKFSVHALEQWAAPAGQAVNDGATVNNIQTRSNISSDETTVGEFVLRSNTK